MIENIYNKVEKLIQRIIYFSRRSVHFMETDKTLLTIFDDGGQQMNYVEA